MKIKNLLPWNWRKNDVPVRRECMFESIGMFPRIDVRESDKETVIEAELPGMKKEDIEVSISNGALIIKAERREERKRIDEASTHWHDRSVCSKERFRFRTASTSITSKPASNAACFA